MTQLIGALTNGFILALLALGVFITYRIFRLADITVDGSITFGAAIASVLLLQGLHPLPALAAAFVAGALAGTVSGIIQTRFRIDPLLTGILVMTALYSVNLHVMGRSNISLLTSRTLGTWCNAWGTTAFGSNEIIIAGWPIFPGDLVFLGLAAGILAIVGGLLYAFFRTELGTAMRACGDNPQMIRALGANVDAYRVLGLALSNGLVALAGALLAQYQGFADVQMGIGMIVWGLASVIIGEALTGSSSVGLALVGAVMGSILFRLLVAVALRWGLNPNDLKLITATFVFGALVLPGMIARIRRGRGHA